MSIKVTILGCGNSSGVPAIGNYWGDCDPNEPKNIRMRCCLAVQSDEATIIVDTGADLRHQLNKFDVNNLDAVFYTHQHSDHCHGIDDLRPFYFRNDRTQIQCFGKDSVLEEIKGRFHYLFSGGSHKDLYPPVLEANPFDDERYGSNHEYSDITYVPFKMDHGTCTSIGYRFGDLSYCVDMKSLDDNALDIIKGSKIWIVDGAGFKDPQNSVHADLNSIYEYNKYIKADRVYITCLSSMMDYNALCNELPEGFYPAYDGLHFDLASL